jgi:hypothetical protein
MVHHFISPCALSSTGMNLRMSLAGRRVRLGPGACLLTPAGRRGLEWRASSRVLHLAWILCLALAVYPLLGGTTLAGGEVASEVPTQVLELHEWFGVDHPEQIIEFALDRAATPGLGTVLEETGSPVPFQLLEHGRKLAIRTGLAANSRRAWRWFSNRPAMPVTPAVEVKRAEREWEISNELIAVRIPRGEAIREAKDGPVLAAAPLLEVSAPRVHALAPIQGVRLRDGTWSGLGPNLLAARALKLLDASVEMVEAGPLKAVVQVRYDFDKPQYSYGLVKIADPGPGYLRVTITVLAGQPSILVEEDTDLDEVWAMNLYNGLRPDRAQYNGHHSTDPKFGHLSDGSIYPMARTGKPLRGEPDAIVDLQYQTPQVPSYVTSAESWRYLAVWDPWIFDGGWYWQLYNSAAPGT